MTSPASSQKPRTHTPSAGSPSIRKATTTSSPTTPPTPGARSTTSSGTSSSATNLFPPSVRQSELAFYKAHINKYGLPLDSRADYTKLDWSIWTATLAANPADFNAIMNPIALWLNEGPTRVPLTDWYDTKNGKQIGFQARSVVGGVYIKALADKQLTQTWRAKATAH